jgi:hypothetical protein
MKKMKKVISTVIVLALLSLSFTNTSFAKEIDKWVFTGTVTPRYEFMLGDSPIPSDFEINGVLSNSDGSIKYDASKLTLRSTISTETSNTNTLLKELTNPSDSLQLSFYVVSKNNSSIKALTTTNIKVGDFSSKAVYELDSKTIELKKSLVLKSSIYDTMPIFDNREYFVFNTNGRKIDGVFSFKGKDIYRLRFGYNNINYHFDSSATKYDDIDSSFTVKYLKLPKITTSKNSISIKLDNSDSRYLFIVNGKQYETTTIPKLKSKTAYKLSIYQNGLEKTLLYIIIHS